MLVLQQMKVEEISYLQNKYYSICKELMIVKSQVKDLQLKLATEKEKTRSHNEEVHIKLIYLSERENALQK